MSPKTKQRPLQYSICVSGAASGPTIKSSWDEAEALGKAIAEAGHVLTTGATVGLPYYAAKGAKEAGGMSIGFSPASSLREHLRKYRLPYDYFDFINFTGLNYVGRDLYLVQSSDAVLTVGGRIGSLHEFTSALESRRPCGVLIGSGGTADMVAALVNLLDPTLSDLIIYDEDPLKLVARIVKVLDKENKDLQKEIDKRTNSWFLRQPEPPRSG
ncbi:MAG TPA: hypothetical protein VK674_00680 [Candidatus Limnocylindria bacterium]|nr:hypothetical protein [Candidatus Limnocylindria bacterium]